MRGTNRLNTTTPRYCHNPRCQATKPQSQRCIFCGDAKDMRTGFRPRNKTHWSDRCYTCEHPACAHCGVKHIGKQAIREDHPSVCGKKFTKRWYCQTQTQPRHPDRDTQRQRSCEGLYGSVFCSVNKQSTRAMTCTFLLVQNS